jgi:hypothetical protein
MRGNMHHKNNFDFGVALLLLLILFALSIYLAFHTHATWDDYCHARQWKTTSGWYDYTQLLWSEWSSR